MDTTRLTLLEQAGQGSAEAWDLLYRHYRGFIVGWFRNHGVPPPDAEDLSQDVMAVLLRQLREFVHSGRTGAFRAWLRGVCLNCLRDHRRAAARHGQAVGGSDFQASLQQQADDDALQAQWDRAHDEHVLRQLLERLPGEFEEATLRAFRRVTFEGAAAADVAAELGTSAGAVYVAKSRVMRRLRELARGLIDDATSPNSPTDRPSADSAL
jgi:RNA polymerase sigma-70 factor (ECF subfamily)